MLSIIIPALNEEKYLPKLLRSLQNQSYRDFEVIVADAGSHDWTRRIAHDFGAKIVEGGMPGPGRNAGAAGAKGNIFLFLDADVVLPDAEFLRKILAEFHRRKLDVATLTVEPLSEKTTDRLMHGVYNVYLKAVRPFAPHAPGFCIIARRTSHESISGFDETIVFCEDKDYVSRSVRAGFKFRILQSEKIQVSVRRFERDGRWAVARRYLLAEVYQIFKGKMRKQIFPYEFGKYDKKIEMKN
ncbi:glycosyltransferase [Candidatus Uhrbacteria bacterium]|nr:glycosyltransferase [Candidatus Uhrbacteria bacterium]